MVKRLNIFMLMILIVGQTILGPIGAAGVAFAEESDPIIEQELNEEDLETGDDSVEIKEKKDSDKSLDEPETEQNETDDDNANYESTDQSKESESVNENKSDVEDNTEQVPADDETDLNGVIEKAESDDTQEEGTSASEFGEEAQVNFVKLVVNGTEITDPAQAHGIEPTIGDNVVVHYNYLINPEKDYGVGSTFTFNLPPALLNFDNDSLSGTLIGLDDIKFEYTTTNKTVTVKLIEGTVEDGSPFSGNLNFSAKFDASGAEEGLEQELEIPIAGGDTLKFPFTFKPTNTGQSMSKSGTPTIEGNDRYIEWTVWTNREGANLQGATLNDTLGGIDHGLELDGYITVEQYVVGMNGVEDTGNKTTTANSFPVSLEDGRYAYKLTYKTKVTRVQQNETEPFTNSARLESSDTELGTAEATVSHTYGTKLDKTVTASGEYSKYNAKWEIKYNYFGSKIDSQTLIDTITGPHKIKEDTIKVYPVNVASDGTGTPDKNNPLTFSPGEVSVTNEGKKLSINLKSPEGEAYLIEYETEFESEYVTKGEKVTNNVSDGDNSKDAEFWVGENIFDKKRASVDYDKKEITWTIEVTAEKVMKEFVILDIFKDYGESDGKTRQTLLKDENDKYVKVNNISTDVTLLESDPTRGFELSLGEVNKGQSFTITYKTEFDILPNGTPYEEYMNTAKASWKGATDGKDYDIPKSADYTPGDSPTGKNGYKNGSFDHKEQEFNWNLAVNINKQNIKDATLIDTIDDGHKLVQDSIKVHKLILAGDDTGTKGDEVNSGFEISNKGDQGFTIKFTADTTDAYIITYQTVDSDEIIGNDGTNTYGNKAVFTTINDNKFELPASTTVKHANELIKKEVQTNPDDETITWTIDVNKSHSTLGDITLTDKMSDNQLILPETFKKREILMDADGNISHGNWEDVTPSVKNEDNSFTLDLGELNQKGYQIEYKTFFLGAHKEDFTNEASINYSGDVSGTTNESDVGIQYFYYNASSGTVSDTRGNLELHKVGLNPVTGEQVDLPGITFHLLNKTGTIKIAETTTGDDGKLTFEDIRYGKYQLEEQDISSEYGNKYKDLPPFEITLNADIDINEGGKTYVVENIEDVEIPPGTCTEFTLTVKDVDGDPRESVELKLVNKNTGELVTVSPTNDKGIVEVDRDNLPAGPYEVFELGEDEEGNPTETKLDEVTVNYNKCNAKIQPNPTCTDFTITLKVDNESREGEELTIKDGDDKVIATETTDDNGSFTVPSKDLPAGTYYVYKGEKEIGTVDVSYKDECEAEVTLFQVGDICPKDTITVKLSNGNPDKDTEVTIKEKDSDSVVYTGPTNQEGKILTAELLETGTTYEVIKNGRVLGEFTKDLLDCEYEVQPRSSGGGGGGWTPPTDPEEPKTCDDFTITVKEDGTPVEADVELTLKSGTTEVKVTTDSNGKVVIDKADLPEGSYTAYDKDGKEVGTITVTYEENKCNDEIDITAPGKTCENHTVTIKEDGTPVTSGEYTFTSEDGETKVTGTVDSNGKVTFDRDDLPEGKYTVTDKDGTNIGSITVEYTKDNCETELNITTSKVCEDYTVTILEDGTPVTSGEYTFTSEDGQTTITASVDSDGKIVFDRDNLPEGKYTVTDKDGNKSSITVNYTKDFCEDTVDMTKPEEDEEDPKEEDPKEDDKPTNGDDPSNKGDKEEDDSGTKGSTDSDDDKGATKGSQDSDETGLKGSEASQTGGIGLGAGHDGTDGDGKKLPKTATNIYNLALIGFGLLVLGIWIVLYRRKQHN